MGHAENHPDPVAAGGFDTGAALGQITRAMHAVHTPDGASGAAPAALSANQVLAALTLLRELRTRIAGWEPELIEAARALGTSWADLAPALGVASRQAAERRYLRLRPSPDDTVSTGDQRVAAERDKRAGDKAVATWARDNAGDLRQLAGQIGALGDLGAGADADLAALRRALGGDDAADLLGPLADTRSHLTAGHPGLAEQIGDVSRRTAEVRAASDRARRPVQP
ncbi:HSP18 transcriptional regulator [Catenulispora subtropica]|uniref:HSP18 transcriptional regulator n=1 Tax=Catenulispora subtropica TaxID=450798 RepID=A0ABN2RM54_9ACTN